MENGKPVPASSRQDTAVNKERRWPDGWCPLAEEEAGQYVVELQRELSQRHILEGIETQALGQRIGHNQFLFKLEDGSNKLAMVHLTWAVETDPKWPWTEIFNSFDHWVSITELHFQKSR